jgi:hypothetical protein
MRKLLFLACLAVAGCDPGHSAANGTSVTVTLPPPAEPPAEPGFTVSIVTDIRPT